MAETCLRDLWGGVAMLDRMLGDVKVSRVQEGYMLQAAKAWFPDFDPQVFSRYEKWLAPRFYKPDSGEIIMPSASWILRDGKTVTVIDTCIGNHKDRLGFDGLHQL